jgi:hypothetical protein
LFSFSFPPSLPPLFYFVLLLLLPVAYNDPAKNKLENWKLKKKKCGHSLILQSVPNPFDIYMFLWILTFLVINMDRLYSGNRLEMFDMWIRLCW